MRALIIEIALLRMRFETRMSLKACAQKRRCAKMFALRNEGGLKRVRSVTRVR